jgi:hypothetical protein
LYKFLEHFSLAEIVVEFLSGLIFLYALVGLIESLKSALDVVLDVPVFSITGLIVLLELLGQEVFQLIVLIDLLDDFEFTHLIVAAGYLLAALDEEGLYLLEELGEEIHVDAVVDVAVLKASE